MNNSSSNSSSDADNNELLAIPEVKSINMCGILKCIIIGHLYRIGVTGPKITGK